MVWTPPAPDPALPPRWRASHLTAPRGGEAGLRALAEQRARFDTLLPELMRRLVDQHICQLEHDLLRVQKSSDTARRLRQVPGIGLMGDISKRGDPYVRTLLVSGARSLMPVKHAPEWIIRLLARRPPNVVAVAVAVANRLARIAWALVAHGRDYQARCSSADSRDVVPT